MGHRALLAMLLLLAVLGPLAHQTRRAFIRSFFVDGPPGPPPPLTPAPAGSPGLAAAARVRVLLIDGLDLATARQLPVLGRLCTGGRDLQLDVGFPTVSLPVQAVLWTGLTQQQTGLWYRVAGLERPLAQAAPARLRGSVVVAEEQAVIAASFGFSRVWPGSGQFAEAAELEVAGGAPLVFVHLLRVDKAGHKQGAASPAYRQAAFEADALLARLVAAAPPAPGVRWLVLSDHGQRARGGHGGAERDIRFTRACLAGGPDGAGPAGSIHLVDLARALFDSLALPPVPAAVGRPLAFALAHPDPGATIPAPRLSRVLPAVLAGALLLALAVAAWRRVRDWLLAAIWLAWLPLAFLGLALWRGWPTLSNPVVYPPQGRDMVLAALPALILLLAATAGSVGRRPERAVAIGLGPLALLLAPALAALIASGGLAAAWGAGPPLDPRFTGPASFLLAISAAAGPGLALATLAGLAGARWWPGPAEGGRRESPVGPERPPGRGARG